MLKFYFSGAEGIMTEGDKLTSGMVGKTLYLEFSPEWETLAKTVVFSNGQETASRLFTGNPVEIPAEILKKPLRKLTVGVYGVSSDGRVVIPTIRAEGPVILPGVEPVWSPEADPELPVWAQLQAQLGNLDLLETEACENLVAAINELAAGGYGGGTGEAGENGATFRPSVSAEGVLSWTNDKGLENPAPVNIKGPTGSRGEPGEQGYSLYATKENAPIDENAGTETEFTLSEIVIPEGRSLRVGDFLVMEEGCALFSVVSVTEENDLVVGVYVASLRGPMGADGKDGSTPVRGTDYWTEADKAEIKSYVDTAILGGAW